MDASLLNTAYETNIILAKPGRYEIEWSDRPSERLQQASAPANAIPISRAVFEEILAALNAREPECGGILIGPRNNRLITHFVLDQRGQSTPTSFTLDATWLNTAIAPYLLCELDIKGFVHSHPSGCREPSGGDRRYLERLLANPRNQVEEVFFPIQCDGRLNGYIVTPHSLRVTRRWAIPANIQLF